MGLGPDTTHWLDGFAVLANLAGLGLRQPLANVVGADGGQGAAQGMARDGDAAHLDRPQQLLQQLMNFLRSAHSQ